MPGKVNPVIPEVVNQVAFMVIGHDLTVTMCAEGGQLQLNAFEPTIGYCVLSSLRILTAAVNTLTRRCVLGIEADHDRCRTLVEDSIGLVTALGPRSATRPRPAWPSGRWPRSVGSQISFWRKSCSRRSNSTTCCASRR